MDLHQHCLYCSKMYSYIGAYITHLCRDHKERILYVSAKQLPDDGFAIEQNTILLRFVHEPHCDPFLHTPDNDCSEKEVASEHASIDPEQPPVRTRTYSTPHLDNRLAGKPISNERFNIFDNAIDLWLPLSHEEQDRLAQAELLSMSFSGILRSQQSATSLWPTLYSKRWTKCPTRLVSTLGHLAKCVTIFRPIPSTFTMMIWEVSFTPIQSNALSSSCNSLHPGKICDMLQQRNSILLRNVSTQRWKQATGGWMSRLVEYCRRYNDFDSFNSYGCPLELRWSLHSGAQTRHILPTFRVTRMNHHDIWVSETSTRRLD